MRQFIRYTGFFFLFLSLLSTERAIGLPCLTLAILPLSLSLLHPWIKVGSWIVLSIFLAVIYHLPFVLSAGILLFLLILTEYRFQFFQRETLKLFSGWIIVQGILFWYLRLPLTFANMIYHLVLSGLVLLFIRYWYRGQDKLPQLSIAERVKKVRLS